MNQSTSQQIWLLISSALKTEIKKNIEKKIATAQNNIAMRIHSIASD